MVSMRKFMLLTAFLLGLVLIVGSSGNFRAYTAKRNAEFDIVSGNDSYIGCRCLQWPISVNAGSSVEFTALTVENRMDRPITFHVEGDYSALPEGISGSVDGSVYTLEPGDSAPIMGTFSADGYVGDGAYEVPLTVYADWDGGSAKIETCSMNVTSIGGPTIKKELLSGDTEVPLYTYQQWVFRITVTNHGAARNLTIKDVVGGEFEIDSISPSAGNYTVNQHGASTHILWDVELSAGGSAYLDVTVHTKINPAGKQEFTSCGTYSLNDGAEILGYGIVSNGILIRAVWGEDDDSDENCSSGGC